MVADNHVAPDVGPVADGAFLADDRRALDERPVLDHRVLADRDVGRNERESHRGVVKGRVHVGFQVGSDAREGFPGVLGVSEEVPVDETLQVKNSAIFIAAANELRGDVNPVFTPTTAAIFGAALGGAMFMLVQLFSIGRRR